MNDDVAVEPESTSKSIEEEPVGLTEEELEPYRDDPFWKTLRFAFYFEKCLGSQDGSQDLRNTHKDWMRYLFTKGFHRRKVEDNLSLFIIN